MTAVTARSDGDRSRRRRAGPTERDLVEPRCWCEIERLGDAACLRVHGYVDRSNDLQLRRSAAEAAADGRQVVVDLTDATFLDSGGLHVLADLAALQRATGHRLAIHDPSPFGRRVLAVVGLDASPLPVGAGDGAID